jgi:hypothetical protein
MEIGQHIEGKGIYAGTRELKDSQGASLGTFNLFAAPEDLCERGGRRIHLNFANAVFAVSGLREWHGHNGAGFESDEAFYKAVRDGSYKGEWIIPPLDLLKEHLLAHKEAGALAGSFKSAATERVSARSFTTLDQGYFSSTADRDYPWGVRAAVFTGANPNAWASRTMDVLAVRLMRAEPLPAN